MKTLVALCLAVSFAMVRPDHLCLSFGAPEAPIGSPSRVSKRKAKRRRSGR